MFLGDYQQGGDFRDAGNQRPAPLPRSRLGSWSPQAGDPDCRDGEIHRDVLIKWHQTKKRVTSELAELHYNTAIAALEELVNALP